MQRYANLRGDSGIAAFEIGSDFLRLRFVDGSTYLYSRRRPGAVRLDVMKDLARRGEGLARFINQHVRDDYERRED